MLLLRCAVVFMLAALISCAVMLATNNVAALYAMLALVIASYLCVYSEDMLHKRSVVRKRLQRIASTAHTNNASWQVKR